MRFLSSIRIVRISLALAVAFWMAGAGCLLGCENMVSAATATEIASPNPPAIVVTGEACASMHSHDCCAKRNAHSAAKAVTNPTSDKRQFVADSGEKIPADSFLAALVANFPMMECPLAVNASAVLSKAGSDDSNIALPSGSEIASLSNLPKQTSALARPLRLPNRGHTYLRCCSFLI
jgi:hypothetical protein